MSNSQKIFRYLNVGVLVMGIFIVLAYVLTQTCFNCSQEKDDFKVYQNYKYAYQIEYPSGWKAEGTGKEISESIEMTFFTNGKSSRGEEQMTSMTVHVYENLKKLSPKDWYLRESRVQSDGIYPYPNTIVASAEETEVNGYTAYKIITTDLNYDYFIGYGNTIYRLSFEKFGGDETWTLPTKIYDRMLTSFKMK